ncbi:RNA polymerase subunit sigma [Thioclava sp. DLFJ5-1]|uniref:sigma-70 family RNA polymerase sigma factor n=1 Tax=Thioclava sp. DLFJ5-1 TaxID=1915314 RepID=UPI000995E403|nr:sigma-70 family RNA polymerase sigma factor [Thioclava sp. DLFJ5-1]OOY19564.1 RNA polymerase subunit sigma [Thioclava sp. DLFJ5-1]
MTKAESCPVAQALHDCAEGDVGALERLVALEGGRMLGVAKRILGRTDLAEEALQEALVRIWRKAGQFSGNPGSAKGWVYTVLRSRCLNILRDGKRLSLLSPEELGALQDAREQSVPEEGWQMLAGSSRLRDCLEALDPASRHSILLAHVGGFSHGEIAARQSVPLGTAKSWIRRGLASLRECLS